MLPSIAQPVTNANINRIIISCMYHHFFVEHYLHILFCNIHFNCSNGDALPGVIRIIHAVNVCHTFLHNLHRKNIKFITLPILSFVYFFMFLMFMILFSIPSFYLLTHEYILSVSTIIIFRQ